MPFRLVRIPLVRDKRSRGDLLAAAVRLESARVTEGRILQQLDRLAFRHRQLAGDDLPHRPASVGAAESSLLEVDASWEMLRGLLTGAQVDLHDALTRTLDDALMSIPRSAWMKPIFASAICALGSLLVIASIYIAMGEGELRAAAIACLALFSACDLTIVVMHLRRRTAVLSHARGRVGQMHRAHVQVLHELANYAEQVSRFVPEHTQDAVRSCHTQLTRATMCADDQSMVSALDCALTSIERARLDVQQATGGSRMAGVCEAWRIMSAVTAQVRPEVDAHDGPIADQVAHSIHEALIHACRVCSAENVLVSAWMDPDDDTLMRLRVMHDGIPHALPNDKLTRWRYRDRSEVESTLATAELCTTLHTALNM